MTTKREKPAFTANGKAIYHSYKEDSPASYWYRLTPDKNGRNSRSEDLTGAFDVRSLSALTPPPCYSAFMTESGDVNEDYDNYKTAFMLWVKETCESDFKSIKKVTIK